MARFCTGCGKEIPEGVAFCTECGTPRNETERSVPAETPERTTSEAPPPPPPPPPSQQTAYAPTPQQTYAQPQAPAYAPTSAAYQQPAYHQQAQAYAPAPEPKNNKVVGTGAYFGLMFLFALPLIGFIACIIMAFAVKNQNLKNFARAQLIWAIIGLVFGIITIALGAWAFNEIVDFIASQIG